MNINDVSIENNSGKLSSNHIHEFSADTNLISIYCKTHNHNLKGITEKAISIGKGDHKHQILCVTDNTNHFHSINIYTGRAIPIGNGIHVHNIDSYTDSSDDHIHSLNFATSVNSIKSSTKKLPPVVSSSEFEDINPEKVMRSKRTPKSPKISTKKLYKHSKMIKVSRK